ncbi:MAG: hypothetical protein ABIW46_05890, partial [Acidimicrobiales bacterium]
AEYDDGLGQVESFDALLAMFEHSRASSRTARDGVLLGVLRLAPTDPSACRTVIQLLRAGLVNLTRRAAPWWGWEEAASAVIAAAVGRINRYPMHRTSRVAANLLGDMWHAVWVQREAERRRETCGIELVDMANIDDVAADDNWPRRRRGAAGSGRRSRQTGANLTTRRSPGALHRVFGLTNVEVAGVEGCRPCTVRKRRAAAEAAIAELAVA